MGDPSRYLQAVEEAGELTGVHPEVDRDLEIGLQSAEPVLASVGDLPGALGGGAT